MSRLHYGPLDQFGPEDNDPGTAFIIHNVDDTVTIKIRSPGDRVYSEVEIPLDAWLKLRSVPALYAHPKPQQADGRGAVIEADSVRAVVVGECAKLITELTLKHGRATGTDYEQGVMDHGYRLLHKVRALSRAPATDGAGSSHTRPNGVGAT